MIDSHLTILTCTPAPRGSGPPSRPDNERITYVERVAREDQAQKNARAASGILFEKHGRSNNGDDHFDRGDDAAVVAGVPVRDRTLKAPIREREEMSVRVFTMEREIANGMEHHAEQERRGAWAREPARHEHPSAKSGKELKTSKKVCQPES